MPLPELQAIKLDLYTLACNQLLTRLNDLKLATSADQRNDYLKCVQVFDNILDDFFHRAKPS